MRKNAVNLKRLCAHALLFTPTSWFLDLRCKEMAFGAILNVARLPYPVEDMDRLVLLPLPRVQSSD